ncbi:MAG: hypothetical protein SFV15_13590 [Polyangiaceae bacterium]|nr:hypothetical protein [Polyangiaceae bacterium]
MTLRITAQAHGAFGSKRWRWIPYALAGGTVLLVAVLAQQPDAVEYLPYTGLPTVALLVWLFVGNRMRSVEFDLDGRTLNIQTGTRSLLRGKIEGFECVPWVLPGLGSTHGAAVRLSVASSEGAHRALIVAAAGKALPSSATGDGSTSAPDCFVSAGDFDLLLKSLGIADVDSNEARDSATLRFTVVRHEGAVAALRGMLPWLLTLAFVGVLGGLVGETMMQKAPWLPALVSVLAIGYGLYRTFLLAKRPKPRFAFVLAGGNISLSSPNGKSIWAESAHAVKRRYETYVYRTRYGTYRFPVLVLQGVSTELRLGVWEPGFALSSAKEGAAPDFLVGTPDWQPLMDHFER